MTDKVRFVYVTNKTGRKTTVAYQYNDEQKHVFMATAECSPRDRFVKKIGRDIAFNRLAGSGVGIAVSYSAMGGSKYGDVARWVSSHIDEILRDTSKIESYIPPKPKKDKV